MSVYPSKKLYTILQSIIIIILLIIIGGTIAAFISKPEPIPQKTVQEISTEHSYTPQKEHALYGDIGQIRASTVDTPAVTIIVTPFLEYREDDTAFQEELVNKKELLKQTILHWFSMQSAYRLSSEPAGAIKEGLMEEINKQLMLGNIRNIYFEEFAILY